MARSNVGAAIHAEAFYLRLGARRIGAAPSDAIADRLLPLLEYELAP